MFAEAQDQLFHNSRKFPGCPMLKKAMFMQTGQKIIQ